MIPSAYNLPTAASYNVSLVIGIGMYINDDSNFLSDCFLVIFDSGEILVISPARIYFIGSITHIPDLCLSVMANGMIIEGKGIAECYFFDGNQKLIIRYEC